MLEQKIIESIKIFLIFIQDESCNFWIICKCCIICNSAILTNCLNYVRKILMNECYFRLCWCIKFLCIVFDCDVYFFGWFWIAVVCPAKITINGSTKNCNSF